MNKIARVAIASSALLVALLASACTTTKTGAPAARDAAIPALPESATESTATPTEPQPLTNERGFVPKKLGEEACYGPIDDDTCGAGVTFSVDKIVVDPPCSEWGERTGHTLVVSMRVATGTDSASIQDAGLVFNPYSFVAIDKNGVSQKAEAGMCTDAADITPNFGVNQKYVFKLELDVPAAHGILALQPGVIGEDGTGGWEWKY